MSNAAPIPPVLPAPPPPPPRPISNSALRRSWIEPQIRTWWLCALLFVAAALCLCLYQIVDWRSQSRLIRTGRKVDALIVGYSAEQLSDKKSWTLEPDRIVYLQVTLDGQTYMVHGVLPPRKKWYETHTTIPIFVDPGDPQAWTAYNRAPPLAQQFVLAYFLLPLALILGAGAWVHRRYLLAWWRDGEAAQAVVVESRQSSSAPRSRLLCCELKIYSPQPRQYFVIYPKASAPCVGEELWLIVPGATSNRALAARLYQD